MYSLPPNKYSQKPGETEAVADSDAFNENDAYFLFWIGVEINFISTFFHTVLT